MKHLIHIIMYLLLIEASLNLLNEVIEGGGDVIASPISGSLEADLNLAGEMSSTYEGVYTESPQMPSWSFRPVLDYPLSEHLWLGGELGLRWLSYQVGDEIGSRMSINPYLRGRMDFPLSCRWIVEGVFAFGITTWGGMRGVLQETRNKRLWGFGVRMNLGIRYILNTKVHLLMALGYSEQEVSLKSQNETLSMFPILIGLRGNF